MCDDMIGHKYLDAMKWAPRNAKGASENVEDLGHLIALDTAYSMPYLRCHNIAVGVRIFLITESILTFALPPAPR